MVMEIVRPAIPASITIGSSLIRSTASFVVQQHTERHEQENIEHEMTRVSLRHAVLEQLETVLQAGSRREVERRERCRRRHTEAR